MKIEVGKTYRDNCGRLFYVHGFKPPVEDIGLSEAAIIEDVTHKRPRGKEFPWARWLIERETVAEVPAQ